MGKVADHYAEIQDTMRVIEVKKISTSERTRNMAAKHIWYIKKRYGTNRNLLIPDYRIHNILAIIGVWALILLIQQLTAVPEAYTPSLIILIGARGAFTAWTKS